jgi:UrcA family protein
MNLSAKRSILSATLVLSVAAVPVLSEASPPQLPVKVGDLSTRQGVKAFDDQLRMAALNFCRGYSLADIPAQKSCLEGVREEALGQLSPAQLTAYQGVKDRPAHYASATGRTAAWPQR